MQRGLQDRRIAVFAAGDRGAVTRALELRGARVTLLHDGSATRAEDWHGARYAALVVADAEHDASAKEPRLVQLVREFLVADKPVAVYGGGIQALHEAGGVEDEVLVAQRDGEIELFATGVAEMLVNRLDEAQLDDMSDQSFPASDPPSTTPAAVGRPKAPGTDQHTR